MERSTSRGETLARWALLLGTACFAMGWVVARACVQSVTIDEADAYLGFVAPAWPAHWYPAAANHILNTILVRVSTSLFGISHLTLRLPALVGAAIYIACSLRFCLMLHARTAVRWVLLVCLICNPFVMDHLVAARGYSLALAFLMVAVLMAAGSILFEETSQLYRRAALASACAGLSFSANFSFAYIDAAAVALLFAWAWRRAADRRRLAAACLLPGLAVVVVLCSSALLTWPKGQLGYGAQSLSEMWDSMVSSSFYELNPHIVNPLLYDGLTQIEKVLPAALLAVCGARVVVMMRTRQARQLTTPARPDQVVLYLGAVLGGCLLLHGLSFGLLKLPLPEGRTALFFVPLFVLLTGFAVSAPDQSRWSATTRAACVTVLALGACYFLGCLRLSYFREWKYDADTEQAYRVLDRLSRRYGIRQIPVEWRYLASLNFYRTMYHSATLAPFEAPPACREEMNRYPEDKQVYVLYYPADQEFIRTQRLEILFRGTWSDLVIARRTASDLQEQLTTVHPEKHQPESE